VYPPVRPHPYVGARPAPTDKPEATPKPATTPAPNPDCDPPFTLDERGHKHYKPACL
jgi:serine/threonine-protein kinase